VSGRDVLVDTNVFVSARNRRERGFASCRKLLDAIDGGEFRAIVSTVTIAELRAGLLPEETPAVWRAMVTHFLTSANYRVEPVDVDIAEAAGELRASSHLTLPDALIAATGHLRGASILVTQDREMARAQAWMAVKTPDQIV
jgi:predicted nucleic acid-binding protein